MSTALRLLILEDDPLDAELEVATLEKAGYVCQWERVETRAEFLACLDAPDYDAILVDYNLPAFDGLTALHLYLERDLDLPFIFVSGTMGEETAIESLKAGATDYVLKERLSRLGPVVARALHEREERRQHKRVEEELQKNRRLLNAIVDHSPVAIQIKDLQGHYLLVNKQIETIFDLQRGEAIGRMPYDIFPQEIATKFLADDQDTLKAGTAMQIEEVIPFPDGLHTFIALKFPLADASGEPYAVAGIATDITEQKRAEEALRESEERFRALVQNSPDIIVVMESARSVRYASPAVERILGYSADHFLTNDPFEHVHPDDVQMVQEKLSQAIQNPGTPIRAEFRLKHRDGSWVSIEMITNSLLDKPEVRGIVINARDITKRKRAEEALRENEELLDSILTASAVGIAYTRDRKIIWANDAMAKLFGFTEEEQYVGKDTKMLYASEEEYRRIGEIAYEQRKLGELVEFDAEFRRLDGSPFDGHVKINTLDPLNPMRGIIVSIIDITKRKLTEEALRRNERFLQDVFDAIQDGISVLDTDLNVIQTNRWMEQMYTHHMPLVGQKCYQVYQERHSPCPWCPSLCTIETGKTHTETVPYPSEDNPSGWIELSAFPIKNEQGQVTNVIEYVKDVTEREHLLIQVQEQAQRVQQIIETVPEGVILLDAMNHVILANPLGHKDLAVLADTLVGSTLIRLGERPLVEFLTSPPQGLWHEVSAEGRTFQVLARPIESGPTPGGWVLVVRDITQQREIERRVQQQERLAAVGQLAAGIAHDFNNIMAVISLYAGMSLRTVELPAKIYERLGIIDQQAHRASDLIQQILDFSRRAVLERLPMELGMFLKEQVKLLRRTLPENIKIDLVMGRDEYTVNADLTRVQQMIMNLATNARDSMPEGGQLQIGLEKVGIASSQEAPMPDMKPGEWVCITVADTGYGIPADVLPHIYDPFFTTKPVGLGTGLGLSQVYGIAKQHEGCIDVKSREGEGTTFTIYLPSLAQLQPEPVPYETETLVQGQGQLILVVEDDAATRAALVDSLELLNYRVIEATNGREALSIFERHAEQIALVLSDMVMPEMGGKALLYALRERAETAKVIMLTGHPLDEETFENLKAHGLQGWLLKPLSIERLSQVVAQALEEE